MRGVEESIHTTKYEMGRSSPFEVDCSASEEEEFGLSFHSDHQEKIMEFPQQGGAFYDQNRGQNPIGSRTAIHGGYDSPTPDSYPFPNNFLLQDQQPLRLHNHLGLQHEINMASNEPSTFQLSYTNYQQAIQQPVNASSPGPTHQSGWPEIAPRRIRDSTKVDTASSSNSRRSGGSGGGTSASGYAKRKREQEKQRRLDLNVEYNSLIQLVAQIEKELERDQRLEDLQATEEEQDETKMEEPYVKKSNPDAGSTPSTIAMESAARRDFLRRFPCSITPSNRADLIARAVSHLLRYNMVHNKQDDDIRALKRKIEKAERKKKESEQKILQIEERKTAEAMMRQCQGSSSLPLVNPTAFVNNNKEQQSQMPMMMMPMLVNSNGTMNPGGLGQFMPVPMGTQVFNNSNNSMMMRSLTHDKP